MQKIRGIPTAELAEVIAGLVKQGVTFEAYPDAKPGEWIVELLGGC